MFRSCRWAMPLALAIATAVPGCAAMNQLVALRAVKFAFDRVSDVRIAGIRIGSGSSFSSLTASEALSLGTAIASHEVPLDMLVHVSATNPPENTVTARMNGLDWTLFVDDRKTLAGGLPSPVAVEPGRTADVPLAVRFDLLQLANGGARDLFDLALAITGQGALRKDLRLELVPTIETSIGPMRYPVPVVVRRSE